MMPELPKKKVGIVACSGEEMAEGTVTRLAALRVLEQIRPDETVTICLPLLLAGGEGDRAFARFYPTVAVDGCRQRCAARATERYSGKPAASVVVTELMTDDAGLGTARYLNASGLQVTEATAEAIAVHVDQLLGEKASRRKGDLLQRTVVSGLDLLQAQVEEAVQATCSCGSGIPVLTMSVGDRRETLIAVPTIFDQFYERGKRPHLSGVADELLQNTRLYNPIPDGETSAYRVALLREFESYCRKRAT